MSDTLHNSCPQAGFSSIPLESIPCAAYVIKDDDHLSLVAANHSFYKLFNCSEEDMRYKYGNRFGALLDENSLKAISGFSRSQKDDKRTSFSLLQHLNRSGHATWVHTEVSPFENEQGSFFCCTSFDVTEAQELKQYLYKFETAGRFVVGQTSLDSFEYDVATGTAHVYYANSVLGADCFDENGNCSNFTQCLLNRDLICPEFVSTFKEAFSDLSSGEVKHVSELQMKNQTGTVIWVRFTLSITQAAPWYGTRAIGIFEDITQYKEAIRSYLTEAQFYQAILSEQDAYGHIDVTENRVLRIGGIWHLYNEIIDKVTYSQLISEFIKKVVHPDDRKHYLEIMQCENFITSLNSGIDRLGCEFRRIVDQNKMVWMQLSVHLFQDSLTGHIYALLYIKNIDAKKKQEFLVLKNSALEQCSNIYPKQQMLSIIVKYLTLAPVDETCALFVLELNDFRFITEIYGNKIFEQIAAQVADILSCTFRKSDLICRFSQDKFLIFLKDISNEEWANDRLSHLYSQLHAESNAALLSCNVGISLCCGKFPFDSLLNQCGIALQEAKQQGKGHSCFFVSSDHKEPDSPAEKSLIAEEAHAILADSLYELVDPISQENEDHPQSFSFDAFVSEHGDIAYLVDVDNFDLICGNKAFYDRLGLTPAQCIGMKCYEAMHKRDTPCPFCSKANWSTDKYYIWKNLNLALEQEFLIKNKLVTWKGVEVMLALAVDISNDKSIVDSMGNYTNESHNILSGVQHMSAAQTLSEALLRAMESIACFFSADTAYFWQQHHDTGIYQCVSLWSKNNVSTTLRSDQEMVNAWLEKRKWKQETMLENPEAMLYHSYSMYQWMKHNNIKNQRWLQVSQNGVEIGLIAIDNITANFKNAAFLDSFSVFIANELRIRSLVENSLNATQFDSLTKLYSRNRYEEFEITYRADQFGALGVLIANFNNLKNINSTLGFKTGNYYIIRFSEMLRQTFPSCLLFRLNGDEFLVLAPDIDRTALEEKMQTLENMVEENGFFSVSMGYSWDNVERDLSILIEQATQTMKINKKRYYDSAVQADNIERRKMLHDLVASLENNEFAVFLQPKVHLETGEVFGAEALIRYNHPKLGIIPPARFVEVLEANNLIRYIDLFVFEEVCKHQDKWTSLGIEIPTISLNFSRLTLQERDIRGSMESIASRYTVSNHNIEVEITESVATMGKGMLYQTAIDLRHAGYSISLDDFGTKYTNLAILADMDFNVLKIDRSLVNALEDQPNYRLILKNVINMCGDLGISVIAEGVETKEQEAILLELGCKLGQGYLYGRPMPLAEFEQLYIIPPAK